MSPDGSGYWPGMALPPHSPDIHRPTIVATFATMTDARTAIEALQRRIDGSRITLLGDEAERAASDTTVGSIRTMDKAIAHNITKSVVVGIVVGALGGALLGAAIAGLLMVLTDLPPMRTFLWFSSWMAFLGAGTWPVASVARHVGYTDAWDLTFNDPDADVRPKSSSPVVVGVHAADDDEQAFARTTLRDQAALSVREVQDG